MYVSSLGLINKEEAEVVQCYSIQLETQRSYTLAPAVHSHLSIFQFFSGVPPEIISAAPPGFGRPRKTLVAV
jgi:hypothetical protein